MDKSEAGERAPLFGALSSRDRKGTASLWPPNTMNKIWLAVNFNRPKTGVSQVLNKRIFREHPHRKSCAWPAVEDEVAKFLDRAFFGPVF